MNRLLIFTAVILAGCAPDPDTTLVKASNATFPPRITVTRIGIFADDLAYQQRRGIYMIKDNQTGKEYFGVSGIGITELANHSTGKTSAEDER